MGARESTATELVVLTGISGSGKSTALHALEDAGYFCVDNLPGPMLETLLDLADDGARDELGRELALRAVPVADHEERLALAGRAPHRVRDERAVLVDLDLSFGTAGLDFNQDPPQTIAEALGDPDRLDEVRTSC